MLRRLMAVSLLLALLLPCLAASGGADQPVKLSFTTEELLADYDQMWAILHESFPFLPLAGKSEAELEALRLEVRAKIGPRVTDAAGLYLLMQDVCAAPGYLAHLGPVSPDAFRLSYDYARRQGEDWDYWVQLYSPQGMASYAQLASAHQPMRYDSQPPEIAMRYIPGSRALHIRYPIFKAAFDPQRLVPIADTLSRHPEAQHVIIDITGNGGGQTLHWMHHIVSAFSEPVSWSYTSYLRLTDIIAPQYEHTDLRPISPDMPGLPDFVSELGMTHLGQKTQRFPLDGYWAPQVDRPLRRWLLVDEVCYSAAEMFTRFCLDTAWATVVGRTTGGDGGVLQGASQVALHHTGLMLGFFVESGANADGSLNPLQGSQPDHFSKPSESPLNACLRLIAEGK